ncbi:glycosyltransferase family protein [Terrilactibacillus sp. S3-3]|nr:glycosyltransferase family protein [Terrilactibacillus sp. S3-3]
MLEYQIERVKKAKTLNQIIVATTVNTGDDPIAELCRRLTIPVYRGSEEDVLSRYAEAAALYQVDVIVRLTSDCPLIDPDVIDQVVSMYLQNSDRYDYVSNVIQRTYPRGLDTEVFPFRVLKDADTKAAGRRYREHVTFYIYDHPDLYRLGSSMNDTDESGQRWTVDTEDDFLFMTKLFEKLHPHEADVSWEEALAVVKKYPELAAINRHVQQKRV